MIDVCGGLCVLSGSGLLITSSFAKVVGEWPKVLPWQVHQWDDKLLGLLNVKLAADSGINLCKVAKQVADGSKEVLACGTGVCSPCRGAWLVLGVVGTQQCLHLCGCGGVLGEYPPEQGELASEEADLWVYLPLSTTQLHNQ